MNRSPEFLFYLFFLQKILYILLSPLPLNVNWQILALKFCKQDISKVLKLGTKILVSY